MPPRRQDPLRVMKLIPVAIPVEIGNKADDIDALQKEIKVIEQQNSDLQAKIDSHEIESLALIQKFRNLNDEKTTQINGIKAKIAEMIAEKNQKIAEIHSDNEKRKDICRRDDRKVLSDSAEIQAKLDVIHQFEKDRSSIIEDIQHLEIDIEARKKQIEDTIESNKRTLQIQLENAAAQNAETLKREKADFYTKLIDETDQAVLLHIQRRNNLEHNLISLQNMFIEYTNKIHDRQQQNAQLRETIEGLHSNELIQRSADQKKTIRNLKREVKTAETQLRSLKKKTREDRTSSSKTRTDESKKMELSIRHQQDLLDHKLQQIEKLREYTLNVLSFRSQLEAEFTTVLGEMIYEVSQRETLGREEPSMESSAARKLSMTSSGTRTPKPKKKREFSVQHTLGQFTLDDRISLLHRFMDRVQEGVSDEGTASHLGESIPPVGEEEFIEGEEEEFADDATEEEDYPVE